MKDNKIKYYTHEDACKEPCLVKDCQCRGDKCMGWVRRRYKDGTNTETGHCGLIGGN